MGSNSDFIIEQLSKGPKSTKELCLIAFEQKYTCKDKALCSERERVRWGSLKVRDGLRSLRAWDMVYSTKKEVPEGVLDKHEKIWHLKV